MYIFNSILLDPVLFTRYFRKNSSSLLSYRVYFLLNKSCLRRVFLGFCVLLGIFGVFCQWQSILWVIQKYPTLLTPISKYAKSMHPLDFLPLTNTDKQVVQSLLLNSSTKWRNSKNLQKKETKTFKIACEVFYEKGNVKKQADWFLIIQELLHTKIPTVAQRFLTSPNTQIKLRSCIAPGLINSKVNLPPLSVI